MSDKPGVHDEAKCLGWGEVGVPPKWLMEHWIISSEGGKEIREHRSPPSGPEDTPVISWVAWGSFCIHLPLPYLLDSPWLALLALSLHGGVQGRLEMGTGAPALLPPRICSWPKDPGQPCRELEGEPPGNMTIAHLASTHKASWHQKPQVPILN